jgi:hypothetical protein
MNDENEMKAEMTSSMPTLVSFSVVFTIVYSRDFGGWLSDF